MKDYARSIWQAVTVVAPGIGTLIHYDRAWIRGDVLAGISVAAVTLPVGVALAELIGVPPEIGIYSALFPLLAYAVFGRSRHVSVGPDAAICLLVAASLAPLSAGDPQRHLALMVLLTLMTGVWLMVGGLLRLGFLSAFLSRPILTGFLNGTALIILVNQLSALLGYTGEARSFFPRLVEVVRNLDQSHLPTAALGLGLLVFILLCRRFVPRLPSALLASVLGIVLVLTLGLDAQGVRVLGQVPAGLPTPDVMLPTFREFRRLLADSAAIALLVFVSGILTVTVFARRNRENVDGNRELIGLGACNIVSGLAQGYPVTGSTSRTSLNISSGARSQMAGVIAAGVMLLVLFFVTGPIAATPKTGLAAIIIVGAIRLFDHAALRELYRTSRLEFGISVAAMLGVLTMGVLPGVALAIGLSLAWLIYLDSRPPDAVLGRVAGMRGFHNTKEHAAAETIPGILIYRFAASVVFYNADYAKRRILQAIASAKTPVEWVVLDASSIGQIDVTGLRTLDELSAELASRDIRFVLANYRRHMTRSFEPAWVKARDAADAADRFPTIGAAVAAYEASKGETPAPERGEAT